ncbi:MAG: glucose/sorbosone family PQQ-dependent dehydrogenase [Albidovulum sp.]
MRRTATLSRNCRIARFLSALALCAAGSGLAAAQDVSLVTDKFQALVVAAGLGAPWEITYGADDHLWVTERTAAAISRIDPATGEKTVLHTFADAHIGTTAHEGLLGMALDLAQNQVYAAYVYDGDPGEALDRRMRLVRLSYDAAAGTLGNPEVVIEGLIAGDDHNGGRVKIGPDGMIYLTQGEHGANQFGNFCKHVASQDLPTADQVAAGDVTIYQGKVLRIAPDGSIPADNPEIGGVRSHIYTYGHRNPQGIVFGPDGTLFQSEQGPKTDDEVNVLQPGGNYGWPFIAGYRDDQAYVYGAWAEAPDCASLTFSDYDFPEVVPKYIETDWAGELVEPLKTFFTVNNGHNFRDEHCGDLGFICWPTIAPASIDYYDSDAVPGWKSSLLLASLKNGAIYRVGLNADGTSLQGDVEKLFDSQNRYRDIAISPDGKTIFVATDVSGIARATTGGATDQMANPGAILAFTYGG